MSNMKIDAVLVAVLGLAVICQGASISASGKDILKNSDLAKKLRYFDKTNVSSDFDVDDRAETCKTSCIQKCLENRKLRQAENESRSPSHDNHLPSTSTFPTTDQLKEVFEKDAKQPEPVPQQCLAGCQEACSFYKRLLTGKSDTAEHEKLSVSDNNSGNGEHTKSSFVTGDSDTAPETSLESATSSTAPSASLVVSDYTTDTAPASSTSEKVDADANESSYHVTESTSVTMQTGNELGGADEQFELRVASLIHQKSLVITELKWNDIGGNPNQAYLVTWELTDGGLKGHLVTDSSSVTLSLWPDSIYQIQVEQFKPMLDSDGLQTTENSALKSLPLIVDTNEISFPMGRSSQLFSTSGEEEATYYDAEELPEYHEEDEYIQDGNEAMEGGEENKAHKSNKGAHSMTLLLTASVCATVLVLVLLSLTAFTWIHLQSLKKVECFSCCFTSGDEPQLLSHEDLSDVLCTSGSSSPAMKKNLKYYRMPSLFGSSKEYEITDLDSEVPVAVISSSSSTPAPYSFFHCSLNNAWSSKESSMVAPTSTSTLTSNSKKDVPCKPFSSLEKGPLMSDSVSGFVNTRDIQ